MIDSGQIGHYLATNLSFSKEGVFIMSQKPYIENLVHIFGMVECNLNKIPMAEGTKLVADMNDKNINPITYRKMGRQVSLYDKHTDPFSFRVEFFNKHPMPQEEVMILSTTLGHSFISCRYLSHLCFHSSRGGR
jgi:hypothetical protein